MRIPPFNVTGLTSNEIDKITMGHIQARKEYERAMDEKYPNPAETIAEDVRRQQEFHLYCGTCGHGYGCIHGVPYWMEE